MKKRIFFLDDIQDFWLFNSLILDGDEIIYSTTEKISSPHYLLDLLKPRFELVSWKKQRKDCIKHLDNCDAFITKDCHPFTGLSVAEDIRKSPSPFKDKTYSISWVGESLTPNMYKNYRNDIKDKFKYHFEDPLLVPLYPKLGLTKGIIPSNSKYYFLNNSNRREACQLLGLDEAREYVTILVTAAHKPTSNEVKILDHIIEHCNKNDIDIIFKTKMKYDDFYRQNIKHEYFFNGNDFYHQTLTLMLISNFTVGFSTSASLEAELMGTPFISFWRTEKHDQEFDVDSQNLEFFYENFDEAIKLANKSLTYRMAQSDNTFVIKKSDRHEYNRIKDDLDLFLQATCTTSCAMRNVSSEWPKFLVHSLWKEIY